MANRKFTMEIMSLLFRFGFGPEVRSRKPSTFGGLLSTGSAGDRRGFGIGSAFGFLAANCGKSC